MDMPSIDLSSFMFGLSSGIESSVHWKAEGYFLLLSLGHGLTIDPGYAKLVTGLEALMISA